MTSKDDELEEFGKRTLSSLRSVRRLDPKIAAQEKEKYLLQAEKFRKELAAEPGKESPRKAGFRFRNLKRRTPTALFRVLTATFLVLIFLVGSSITVFAAQYSLPGEPLYNIKSISEDVRLSLAFSTKAKLDLTLDYTTRRLVEINNLATEGEEFPTQTSDRYQQELERALELASQLDDQQMKIALGEIKNQAESQGMTLEQLLTKLPEQATPAVIRLRERLQEQVMLSSFGESDPQAFRNEIRERQRIQQETEHTSGPYQSQSTPMMTSNAPMPEDNGNGNGTGSGMEQSTDMPGHNNSGNGKTKSTPGSGKQGPNPAHTPKP